MIFTEAPLSGVYVIGLEPHQDERGFFARTWCRREFAALGLETAIEQCSISHNRHRGILRGLHFQAPPHEEVKLVRCVRGAVHDVVIDLRPESPTFARHFALELTAENRLALYVPKGFAHGFQTLEDSTDLFYQISAYYAPAAARGVRWDDPAFGIAWPIPDPIMTERDRSHPDFVAAQRG